MKDGSGVKFFSCQEWKAIGQVKTHLVSKYAPRARAGTVAFIGTVF
jgi:hypothetical protein